MTSVSTQADEARTIAARAIEALSWDELDAYESRDDDVTSPTGRRYRVTSAGSGVSAASNEKACLVKGGRPRGRTRYFPRTERGKLIDVFALTLLVAAR